MWANRIDLKYIFYLKVKTDVKLIYGEKKNAAILHHNICNSLSTMTFFFHFMVNKANK